MLYGILTKKDKPKNYIEVTFILNIKRLFIHIICILSFII